MPPHPSHAPPGPPHAPPGPPHPSPGPPHGPPAVSGRPRHGTRPPTAPPPVAPGPGPAWDPGGRAPVPEPPRPGPGRRSRIALAGALLFVLLAGAAGLVVVRPGPVAGWLGAEPAATSAPTPPPEPSPEPVLAAVAGSAPDAAGVRAAIQGLVTGAALGGRLNVSVVDAATGESLYARAPDALTVPASTTKLMTAVTVLAARGPAYRIPTRAVAGDRPGEVVLVGGGDPTVSVAGDGTYPGAARLDELAAQVRKALGGTAPTRVTVDATLFAGPSYGPGWDSDIPTSGYAGPVTALMTDGGRIEPKVLSPSARHRSPDLAAGRAFAAALKLPAAAVRAVARGKAPEAPDADTPASGSPPAPPTGTGPAAPPPPGAELGRVESPPLVRLVELMLVESDNVLAEALARQVALARDRPATYAGAAAAMEEELTGLGLPGEESGLVDGSGLSRRDRLTPSVLTDLLALAARGERPELGAVLSGLPVGGWSGTLAYRFQAPGGTGRAGVGTVRAKTGTLSGVHAMAGVVVTAGGHTLAFALLADGVTANPLDAQARLDAIGAALARCRCR